MAEPLVKGYVFTNDDGTEELYAVTANDKVFESDKHPYSVHFIGAWGWHAIEALPEGVEYIGHYAPPAGVKD